MGSRPPDAHEDFSLLLERVRSGDAQARERVVAAVYDELRQLARQRLRRSPHASLQPTELVHEMYGRLFDKDQLGWENRRHFFAIAARAMQDIVIERARAAMADKRGGGVSPMPLSQAPETGLDHPERFLLLGVALDRLEAIDPVAAEVVRLRYFVGLSGDETAEALGISPATVDRRWLFARAWLHRELHADRSD